VQNTGEKRPWAGQPLTTDEQRQNLQTGMVGTVSKTLPKPNCLCLLELVLALVEESVRRGRKHWMGYNPRYASEVFCVARWGAVLHAISACVVTVCIWHRRTGASPTSWHINFLFSSPLETLSAIRVKKVNAFRGFNSLELNSACEKLCLSHTLPGPSYGLHNQ